MTSTPPRLPGFEPDPLHAPLPPVQRIADSAPEQPDDLDDPDPAAGAAPFEVEVVRSAKRKRSVGAQMRGGVLRITVPSWMSRAEESLWVERMSARFRRRAASDRIDLTARAATLARRYDLPRPREIRWVGDMQSRWGSCTPANGTIRLSDRLAAFPDWVVDYVIVHELAHLEIAEHSPEFWRLVHRYPKAERATGYLIAKSGDVETD